MIKSPVEGSTAALIRLETPVAFSDHVRPICLPDELKRKSEKALRRRAFVPQAERLEAPARSTMWQRANDAQRVFTAELQEYFVLPTTAKPMGSLLNSDDSNSASNEAIEPAASFMPRAEALTAAEQQRFDGATYPLPDSAPQVNYYAGAARAPTRSRSTRRRCTASG